MVNRPIYRTPQEHLQDLAPRGFRLQSIYWTRQDGLPTMTVRYAKEGEPLIYTVDEVPIATREEGEDDADTDTDDHARA